MDELRPPTLSTAVADKSFPNNARTRLEFSSSSASRFTPAAFMMRWYRAVSSFGTAARNTSTVTPVPAAAGAVSGGADSPFAPTTPMMDQSSTTWSSGTGMYLRASNGIVFARSSSVVYGISMTVAKVENDEMDATASRLFMPDVWMMFLIAWEISVSVRSMTVFAESSLP